MTSQKDSVSSESESTRIDLGSDLIDRPTSATDLVKETPTEESPLELLKNAKILLSENFIEDAKKVLHKVILKDPGDIVARQLLSEVHETELKRILGDEVKINRPYAFKKNRPVEEFDPDEVIQQLDRDLDLGLFGSDGVYQPERVPAELQDPATMKEFFFRLEKDLSGASVQDWMDLGIAFLEMDLFGIAIRIFRTASHLLFQSNEPDPTLTVAIISLLAFTFLQSNSPLDALTQLQVVVGDEAIPDEEKIEPFYLMGRAYEAMEKSAIALQLYRRVEQIDPNYRDISKRLTKK